MRLLVVDDDASSRAIVNRVASKALKCSVDEASNGLECLEQLERRRYALIVLDLQMPILGGLETLAAIREASGFRDLPVVMLTGGASEDQVRQAATLGVTAYLAKPIDPARLAARLTQVAAMVAPGLCEPERPGTPVVVVCDADPAFRRRAAVLLGDGYIVHEADSGVDMLRSLSAGASAVPVRAILCGSNTGLLGNGLLVKQIRQLPGGDDIAICAALPWHEVGTARRAGYWDQVVSDALPAEVFVAHFQKVMASAGVAHRRHDAAPRAAGPPQAAPGPVEHGDAHGDEAAVAAG